ncbi:uncharacterized protein LOC26534991 [Drosophila yakuba]|uniref:Uncharacterized protein n=1 Tax=Drosophila yakuba TaxID=7245 RepID=A0A0R1E2R6_DROYA|nr:uncharacterized protein LOC26534991 [Drosophila yakuba]KRK03547.1 uncharacterized protein Dyak_GE27810 [Drosophila yakuba]
MHACNVYGTICNIGLLVIIEMIYIFRIICQPLRSEDTDLNSAIFVAAIHIYLLQVGPLCMIGSQRITATKHFIRPTILHMAGVHLALALLWNPTGLVVEGILSAVKTSDLPQYMHLIRLSTALSFLWCCWNLPKNLWDALPSEIQLGSLGLHYRERFPRRRKPSYHAVSRG